jgi:hypothetical protein
MKTIELTRKELYDMYGQQHFQGDTEYAYTNDGKKNCANNLKYLYDGSYWSKLKFNKPKIKTKSNIRRSG